jgi:hypothetical protein
MARFPSPPGPVMALGCPNSPACCRLGLVCTRIWGGSRVWGLEVGINLAWPREFLRWPGAADPFLPSRFRGEQEVQRLILAAGKGLDNCEGFVGGGVIFSPPARSDGYWGSSSRSCSLRRRLAASVCGVLVAKSERLLLAVMLGLDITAGWWFAKATQGFGHCRRRRRLLMSFTSLGA